MAIIKELDPVQGLVDYILDVKPFHTKVVEVLAEYVHTDSMTAFFSEEFAMEIQLEYPSLSDLENDYQESGSVSIVVASPDETNDNPFVEVLGYNHTTDRVIVRGDRTDVLIPTNTLLIKLTDANDFLVHTASLTINSVTVVPAAPGDVPPTVLHTVIHVPGLQNVTALSPLDPSTLTATLAIPGTVLSVGNVGTLGTYGGITPYGAPSAWPIVSYDQLADGPLDPSALGYDDGNSQFIMPGDRRVEYTVGKSIEVSIYRRYPASMPGNNPLQGTTVLLDQQVYEISATEYNLPTSPTEQQHTLVTVISPALKDATSFGPNDELFMTVTLTPFPISGIITGYGTGEANVIKYDNVPGPDDALVPNPTGNIYNYDDVNPYPELPLVPYTPSSPGSRPPPPTYMGDTAGEQIDGIEPDEINYTGPPSAPNTVTPIRANSFIMPGDVSDIFIPGSIVEIVGTDYVFQILQTTFNGTDTFLRVIETIPPGTYTQLKIRENLVGYGDIFTSSARSDGTLSTNIVEAVTFSWNDNGAGTGNSKDVIDGYQFLIIEADSGSDSFVVNGFAEDKVSVGDRVQVLYAPNNNGLHTVTDVNGSNIEVNGSSLSNAIGGWIELYTP